MSTESKKLLTTLVDFGDHTLPMLKRKPEDGRRIIRQREERMALLNDARIAHEQREVIRQLAGALKDLIPCMEAAFSSEGDAFGILHNDATDALSAAEVASSAAAPYLED